MNCAAEASPVDLANQLAEKEKMLEALAARCKLMENSLDEKQQVLQQVQQAAGLQCWEVDFQAGRIVIGPGEDAILEWPAGAYPLSKLADVIHPDDRVGTLEAWSRTVLDSGVDSKFRLLANGKMKWVHVKCARDTHPSDRPCSTWVVAQDITERKRVEELALAQRDLAHIVREVSSLQDAWETCLDVALRISGMDCGGIYLLDANQSAFELVYTKGLTPAFVQLVEHYPIDTPRAQQVMDGKMLDFAAADLDDFVYQIEGLQSLAMIPFRSQGCVLGCINIASHSLTQLSAHTRQVLASIAAEIGNVIVYLRTKSALGESDRQMRALVTSLDDIVFEVDEQGTYLNVWTANKDLLIRTEAELLGRNFVDIWGEEAGLEFVQVVQRVLARSIPESVEYSAPIAGAPRWFTARISPILASVDTRRTVSILVRDTTERKQAVDALHEREQKLRTIFDLLPVGVSVVNEQQQVIEQNAALERILQLSKEGLQRGEYLRRQYVQPGGSEFPYAELPSTRVLRDRQVVSNVEIGIVKEDGDKIWVMVSAAPLPSGGAVVVTSDISERKQSEQALAESEARYRRLSLELEQRVNERTAELRQSRDQLSVANAALERAAHMKDEFLASMSHELRTPLTGILGISESLRLNIYGELNEKQAQALSIIEDSGRHLLELINDILDLSKIEAGLLDMQFVPCLLEDICRSSLQLTKGMANRKQQKVSFAMTPASLTVNVDARRLKQMLVNLLSNAIKFTPAEGLLGLDVQASEAEQVVKITVWDKGIGIAPENIQELFRPFVQLNSGLAREYTGTGLGLCLVQRMAELHGGSIQVQSRLREGSQFTILLPWLPQGAHSTAHPIQATPGPLHMASPAPQAMPQVLLADDNETTIQVVSDYLNAQHLQVAAARNGRQLLEMVPEICPDIILMDIQMPGMDGLEATRRIRAHPDPKIAKVPIIALTALAMPGDRKLCLDAGANEYLSKPVKLQDLAALILRLLN